MIFLRKFLLRKNLKKKSFKFSENFIWGKIFEKIFFGKIFLRKFFFEKICRNFFGEKFFLGFFFQNFFSLAPVGQQTGPGQICRPAPGQCIIHLPLSSSLTTFHFLKLK